MAVTNKGVNYPTSSDSIAPLETHFHTLALDVDNVGIVSGSQTFTGPADTATAATVTITFPVGIFAAAPKVVASVEGSAAASGYVANVYGTTTATTCVVKVNRTNGSVAETLTLTWFASTYA